MGEEFFREIELTSGVKSDDSDEDKDFPPEDRPRGNPIGVAMPSPGDGLSLGRLAASSTVSAGVQFGWALQLSLLTPYVQTLGIPHKWASVIWLCGPIAGLVVQPYVGAWSDKCTASWGRRRPFILAGVLIICCSVTLIGFSADIGWILGDWKVATGGTRPWACAVFVTGFWLLDFANNAVGGPSRALLADITGPDQRDIANAFCAFWMALGNILGYAAGASGSWYRWFPFLTNDACGPACANLKAAFLISVVMLALCVTVTLVSAPERQWLPATELLSNEDEDGDERSTFVASDEDAKTQAQSSASWNSGSGSCCHAPAQSDLHQSQRPFRGDGYSRVPEEGLGAVGTAQLGGILGVFQNLWVGISSFPRSMRSVLLVMALSWSAWFPFLLFDTDWMGREVYNGQPEGSSDTAALYQKGVREGAVGLMLNSVVLGVVSLLVDPLCRRLTAKVVWGISNFIIFLCMAATFLVTVSAVHFKHVDGKVIVQHPHWVKVAAVIIFAILGAPFAITLSVPYSMTADLISESNIGQGLAMGILNLAVVIPQVIISLSAGPWDQLFGGGNEPAFLASAVFALMASILAFAYLPKSSKYHVSSMVAGHV